ncbi:hypothetical protein Pmani_024981 [Petrolisthes manimaculis]|uniref:Carboxylic ester hydrolase n=1 Tax=Petrolisthes manimaculis TaxID=1843537 RepID=A0AAE1P723_9EUCA|nr:hypothetical protein Pmani_024981 [Petrolisthes manimaculis]
MVRATMILQLLLFVATMGMMMTAEGVEKSLLHVKTRQGPLTGIIREAGPDRSFYSFRGIPYAKPPVGLLRLKNPEPAEAWSGVRENFDPPPCPQFDFIAMIDGNVSIIGEEDCLYLHIYTPTIGESNLPVMVFIHGGNYKIGDPDKFGGSPLPLLTRDVVLVAIQYRLGTLGFLSTEDDVLPGNLGLKDQTLALRWVHDNIHNFGGNPSMVTIFGMSAGASSVHYQILTPSAAGLFQRAIMQSGNTLAYWSHRGDHRKIAGLVADTLECTGVKDDSGALDSQAFLSCLQNAPVDKLVMAQSPPSAESWNNFPLYMSPRIDGEYLPAHPALLVREGRYNKVDIMSGLCAHEGASTTFALLKSPVGANTVTNFTTLAPYITGVDQEEDGSYLTRRIVYFYLGKMFFNLTYNDADAVIQLVSDLMMAVPHDVTSMFHARDTNIGSKVYMYQVDHRPKKFFLNINKNSKLGKNWIYHGDDLQFLFDGLLGKEEESLESPDDLMVRKIMLDLWTNFAATGNPTPDLSLGFRWSPASTCNLHYLSLTPSAMMRPDVRAQTRDFLLDLPTKQNKLLFPEKFQSQDTTTTPGYCRT